MKTSRMFKNIFFRYRIIKLRMGEDKSKPALFGGKKNGFRISLLALLFFLLNFISIDAADLTAYLAGEQILSLFRTGRLLPFEENHLENVRELMKKSLSHPENNKVLSNKLFFNRESKDPKYE